jgi:DNA-binding GntR family transcriptional regulator
MSDSNTCDMVAAHVRRLVFEGRLRRGERLMQDEIAAELGVSRIPVREAVVALDREGWVHVEPRRGARVLGLDHDFVVDHYELLSRYWGFAARLATERGSDADAANLADLAERLRTAESLGEFNARNNEFLDVLLDIACSARLAAVLRVIPNVVPGNFYEHVPGARDRQQEGLYRLTDEILAGDADGAAAVFEELIRSHGQAVLAMLESEGILADNGASTARVVG